MEGGHVQNSPDPSLGEAHFMLTLLPSPTLYNKAL